MIPIFGIRCYPHYTKDYEVYLLFHVAQWDEKDLMSDFKYGQAKYDKLCRCILHCTFEKLSCLKSFVLVRLTVTTERINEWRNKKTTASYCLVITLLSNNKKELLNILSENK